MQPRFDPYRLARNRIRKVLREHLVVASARTLETKLAERGPHWMQEACPPHVVTNALRQLFRFGDVKVVAGPAMLPESPCNLFALADADLLAIEPVLHLRIYLERIYAQHASRAAPEESLGVAGETAVRKAFQLARRFSIAHSWGDVRDERIDGASDGLVFCPTLPPTEAILLVEVKNKREWIYYQAFELWKHIKNAVAMDALPVFVARRIYSHTFEYVFKRIGGIGVEMRAQFAPPQFADVLADAVDSDGLDYFDLRFTTNPGPRFAARIASIADYAPEARQRFLKSRSIVEQFLPMLADESTPHRESVYWDLQAALNAASIPPISLERPATPPEPI
jgi:hypothetical protein